MNAYNYYFSPEKTIEDISGSYTGVRPLIYSNDDPNKTTREYALERHGNLITVFGGKWSTAHALAEKITQQYL